MYTMEYYLGIKRDEIESIVMMYLNLDHVIQGEVSQKEENKISYIKCIYMEST